MEIIGIQTITRIILMLMDNTIDNIKNNIQE